MNGGGPRLRVLMLGPLGMGHVETQARALLERGVELCVGGDSPPELHRAELEGLGLMVSRAPGPPRSRPRGIVLATNWVRRLVRDYDPDLVHAHWVPGFGFAAAAAGASPLVITAWGSDVFRASPVMRAASRFALRRAELVTADSADLLDCCRRLGARRRTEIVQWGVDTSAFDVPTSQRRAVIREELEWGEGPVILSPRSLMPVYNIPVIVEAYRRVARTHADAALVLKHMGPIRIELPELPPGASILGNVPYERMADLYRAADVCVSVTSSDSSPRSVWEAMACGCPCVLSDLPWVHELLEDRRHALLVPPGDVDATAVAIETLLGDPELAAALARNGRALVESELSQGAQMDRLVSLYRETVEGR